MTPLPLLFLLAGAPAIDEVPSQDELGTVCYANGDEKRITPDAVLWLAKMIDGETWGSPSRDDAEWMLWSLVQRSAIWSFRTWQWRDFVQAYSQPINPKWTRTGAKCKTYWADGYAGSIPDSCSQKRVDRRARNIAMTWADTHATARKAAIEIATGNLANPAPGAVGWFAPGTWASREKNGANAKSHHVLLAQVDGNAYFRMDAKPDTTGWDATTVTVVGPGASCPGAAAAKPKAKAKPALGSCETSYGYHKAGTIRVALTDAHGHVAVLSLENAGWSHRICDDATGMIYVGDSDDAYVTDASGKKLRFRVTKVDERWSTAKVIEGEVTPAELAGNKRVVVRKKQ